MAAMTERDQQRKQMLRKLEKQIQGLNNEMEFIEILAQFWPWQNMSDRVRRLEQQIQLLRRQYDACAAPPPMAGTVGKHVFPPLMIPGKGGGGSKPS